MDAKPDWPVLFESLPPETREKVLRQFAELRLRPDEEMMQFLGAMGVLVTALHEVPSRLDESLASATTKGVDEASQRLREAAQSIPGVTDSMDSRIDRLEALTRRLDRIKWTNLSLLVLAAFLIGLALGKLF